VGGDVIKFVEEKEGLAFPDAVEMLADRYGVEIKREREDPRAEEARKRKTRLGELLERVASFYASFLWEADEAAKAREYLASRELGEEVLRAFGVGYAPSAWDTVVKRGQVAGFGMAELAAAGLVQKGKSGGMYDRFRARIIFPVRDGRGHVQGFGARAVRSSQKPKYLNSPESELYKKSRTLFGIERARSPIARAGRAIVVEGYTDVLAAHQAGIEEAVAVMGTAITPEQLRQLAGYVEEVVLALDADAAGAAAMLRAQRVASGKRLRLRVAEMPEGKDPADLLGVGEGAPRDAAAKQFRGALEGALELPTFHVRRLLDGADLRSPPGRDRALDEVVPVLAGMPDSITREELVREIADRLDADPALVARRAASDGQRPARAATGTGGAPAEPPVQRHLSVRERREQALFAMCVASPDAGREFIERLTPDHLSSPLMVRLRDWLAEHLEDPLKGLPRDDEELVSLVTQLKMRAEREPATREAMELNFLELERSLIEHRIEEAQRGGGDPPVELQRQRAELADRIAHAESRA
jgi:DNA primase